jgi:hypothetical protein
MLSVALGTLLWIAYGLPGLVHLTHHIIDFCQSFFVRCVEYYDILKLVILWSGIALFAGGLAYGVARAAISLIKARRVIKKLPLADRGLSVVLINDLKSRIAFTHGLVRPRIYISKGLLNSLDRGEIKSVFLHELHHKRRLDPLRFFLLNFIRDSFFYLPAVKHLIVLALARKEHEADDAAASSMREPLSLASALIKVAAFNRELAAPAAFTGVGGSGSVTGRVRRLVEGTDEKHLLPSARTFAISVLTASFLVLSLAWPLNATFPGAQECSTSHCTDH